MASDLKWNVILVGEQSVGKTAMSIRFVKNVFTNKYCATVAVDIISKKIQVHGAEINLHIWDSAGQEIYKAIVPQYFRKAEGCILVYDVTRITTFHKLSGWLSEFRLHNEKAPVIIVGNKSEDPSCKAVNRKVIKQFAELENMTFMECSAKTGENVDKVFEFLLQKMWENIYPETDLKDTNENNSYVPQKSEENNLSIHQKSEENNSSIHQKSVENNSSIYQKSVENNSSIIKKKCNPIAKRFDEGKEEIIHLSKTPSRPQKKKCPC